MRLTCFAIVVVLATVSAEARAQPAAERHHHLRADVGLGSAVGLAGVSYGYAPVSFLQLEAGVGYGLSGVQLSLMPRLALGSASDRFLVGAGLSAGLQEQDPGQGPMVWLNADLLGYEHRFRFGLSISVGVGLTVLVGGDTKQCPGLPIDCSPQDRTEDGRGSVYPQGRLGVGWWF
jgi:hypothetical protein